MKATLKSVSVALTVLVLVVMTLMIVDANITTDVLSNKTYVRVTVVDLNGAPVHNAKVIVGGQAFNTDNKGLSPSIELSKLTNSYDDSITEWKTTTIKVQCDGYVTAVNFNCVVYVGQTRKLTVKLYPADGSELPFVVYVESPPSDYVNQLLTDK